MTDAVMLKAEETVDLPSQTEVMDFINSSIKEFSEGQDVLADNKKEMSKPGGLGVFFSDNIFRPGNKQRLKDAIKAGDRLSSSYQECKDGLSMLRDDVEGIFQIKTQSEKMATFLLKNIELYKVSLVAPNYNSFSVYSTLITASNSYLSGKAIKHYIKADYKSMGYVVGVMIGLTFFLSIGLAEERKKKFEQYKKECDKERSNNEKDNLPSINASCESVAKGLHDIALTLMVSGLSDTDNLTPQEMAEIYSNSAIEVSRWSDALESMVDLVDGDGLSPEKAAVFVSKVMFRDPDTVVPLQAAYYFKTGIDIEVIQKKLGLSDEAVLRVHAQEMIADGKNPSEIASALDADVEMIERVYEEIKPVQEYLDYVEELQEAG